MCIFFQVLSGCDTKRRARGAAAQDGRRSVERAGPIQMRMRLKQGELGGQILWSWSSETLETCRQGLVRQLSQVRKVQTGVEIESLCQGGTGNWDPFRSHGNFDGGAQILVRTRDTSVSRCLGVSVCVSV